MGSRRLMNRSLSGDGRYYYNGNDINSQNSRGGCRSYLNSVRPESRSTFCSVMAQLTEETQPTFDTTLKSKAVSEATNVKFICMVSGHPAPEVTWYKDDEQLDRYCGLPKYEISRDGKTHTLHIYNCSLEDAAIYQASAQNSRGIVSCSGVLEVGTMSEYKIHQNYFAKLKHRNENHRREQEQPCNTDKENVPAALEISSPERSQRKRRSPMEATPSLGAANSSDDKEELSALSQTSPVEDRIGSPVQEASASVHSISDAEIIMNRDKGSQGLPCIHDTLPKASSQQTTREHFAKKKIKISTAAADRSKENRQNGKEEVTDMEMRNKRGEHGWMEARNTVVKNSSVTELKNKVDTTSDTKQSEKLSVKASRSASELKRTQVAQKPIATQRRPAMKVATETQTEVVEDKKQIESSDKQKGVDRRPSLIKPHSQLQAQNTIQRVLNHRAENCNPSSPDNEPMDLDNNKTEPAVGTCVRILPHSCGGGDVNTDTGDRNVSAHSPRASGGGKTHTEPIEPLICGNVPSFQREVAMELNQQPPLMCEVAMCVTDTHSIPGSCHLASQGQREKAGDQSMGLTKNSTLIVIGHHQSDLESTLQCVKISSGHVSHTLQDGHVTTVMNSSLGEDTLTKMSEKDHTDGNLMIKIESDKLKLQSVATSLKVKEANEMGTSVDKNKENVHVQENFSKEQTANSKHSISLVTEFVQIANLTCMSNPDVVQSQTTNDSSISNVLMKHPKAQKSQRASHDATDNVAKMDIQEQGTSNLITPDAPKATYNERQSYTAKEEHQHTSTSYSTNAAGDKDNENDPEASKFDPSTFLSQHSKTLPSNFIIPAIYITDVDSTSQNNKTENSALCTETNVSNSNSVSQIDNTFDLTDIRNKPTATFESEGLPVLQAELSVHSQTTDINQPAQQPLSEENLRKTDIQGLESQRSTENAVSDCIGLISERMQLCNAEKSKKTNESGLTETKCPTLSAKPGLNLTESDSFIKQLRSAALDLDKSDQSSTSAMLNATTHGDSKGKVKYVQANSAVIQPGIRQKTTDDQILSSETATRAHQKTTFHSTATNKSDVGMAKCPKEAKEICQEDTLSVMPQPASPLQSVRNSPFKTLLERHSPGLTQKGVTADLTKPKGNENVKSKSSERDKENQFKVPQVIRKIRPEVFDTSGHLKLWCQFFNIVSDSTIKWYKNDLEFAEIQRSAGDESQVCLAIVQTHKRDCGVYRCTITNEYGQDATEYLLSTEILSNMFLREELQEVGEEIEMTPLIFSKGLADAGCWGSKFYGRVTTNEAQVGTGCEHKTRRLRVIYGLDPVFESGSSCFMKVRSPIAYESREETVLAEKNLQITKQDCKIQNMAREYFKIFAAETRGIESFGSALEIIPLYFIYRPASSIPYATVEAELKGVYLRYCGLDDNGSMVFNNKLEVAQKCSSLQHWIHQWTNGNVLFSRLEGVDTILTNIGVVIKSKGYQGFPCEANPKVFEQFQTQHQCNYFCGLLNLKPPTVPETLQTARYRGSSSPQTQRKATKSPKVSRRPNPQTFT